MPTFFEACKRGGIASMDEADRIADKLNEVARPLGVRILALRRLAGGGVLFASASRHSIPAGCLVAQLGTAAATEGVELGPESRKAPDESLG